MGDLFHPERALTPSERRHQRGGTQPKGYAARPGSGPKGETCGSCSHLARKHRSATHLKCGLMQPHWTSGRGSDVLKAAPACREWAALRASTSGDLRDGGAV